MGCSAEKLTEQEGCQALYYWTTGLLDRITGLLDYWTTGLLGYCTTVLLSYSTTLLLYCSTTVHSHQGSVSLVTGASAAARPLLKHGRPRPPLQPAILAGQHS